MNNYIIPKTIGHVKEYPTMHFFGNPRHTQPMIAYIMILTEYFWKFQWKIALLECCYHALYLSTSRDIAFVCNCLETIVYEERPHFVCVWVNIVKSCMVLTELTFHLPEHAQLFTLFSVNLLGAIFINLRFRASANTSSFVSIF